MDSPAKRLQRVLIGISVPLYLLSALAIAEGSIAIFGCEQEFCLNSDNRALVFPIIALISTILIVYLRLIEGKEHEDAILDKWISRETEDEMRVRLRREQAEASGESMGSAWAKMEKDHLEARVGEEE